MTNMNHSDYKEETNKATGVKATSPRASKPKPKRVRGRNWCFTDFTGLDYQELFNSNPDYIRYISSGEEVCPDTKKTHWQGWIQFRYQVSMATVKKVMGSKEIHLERMLGSEAQNDKYTQKDGKFTIHGKFTNQGQRTDIQQVIRNVEEGKSMVEVAKENPQIYIQYHNGIQKYKQLIDHEKRKAFRQVETEVITGPTGCGKTRKVMEEHPNCFKIQGDQLRWFDGYEGEDVLLIDEYANDVKITTLLGLLDGYRLRLPVKGGFTYANWTKVYMTTNLRELNDQAKQEHRKALGRRITKTTSYWEHAGVQAMTSVEHNWHKEEKEEYDKDRANCPIFNE